MQVASDVSETSQEPTKKVHKGIRERFNDKIDEEASDQQKTQEIIQTVEQHMTQPKKTNLLDRESERLIREQHDELAEDDE